MRKKEKLLTEQEQAKVLTEEKERNKLKRKSDKSGDNGTTDSKKPIVPILLGFIIGSLLGKLLILILKVSGIL